MRYLKLALTGFLLLGLQACAGLTNTDATTPATAEAVWIDVRTAKEYDGGHLQQAVNIPYDEMAERIDALRLSPDQPIYLYCGSGRRAGLALETLSDLGYTEVTNMGGLEDAREWLQSHPSERNP